MAGARQRETAARLEAGGAEPRNLPTDGPGAVSETAGTSHGRSSTHARNPTERDRVSRQKTRSRPPSAESASGLAHPGRDPGALPVSFAAV
jgi:hypothetical protein